MNFFVLGLLVLGVALCCSGDSSEDGRRDRQGSKSASCQCGWRRHPQSRIVGGSESGVNEWPMMVGILDYSGWLKQHFCGGTIISKRHVLSAAHCFLVQTSLGSTNYTRKDVSKLGIVIGAHQWLGAPKDNYIMIEKYVTHELYNPVSLVNDVAVATVKNIPFSDTVGPACFPHSRLSITGQEVYAVGWGYTAWDGVNGKKATTTIVLKKAKLVTTDISQCATRLNAFDLYRPHQLCTYNPGTSVCPGDSGGPLLWLDPELNRYVVAGITSFVPSSGCTGVSGFVDTSAFIDWIKGKINSDGEKVCAKQ